MNYRSTWCWIHRLRSVWWLRNLSSGFYSCRPPYCPVDDSSLGFFAAPEAYRRERLSDGHIGYLAQQTLGVIRRNLNKCPTHIKAVAYTSLVRPILEYASGAWDPHSLNNIKTLERIQRQAARFCTNNYSREPGSVTQLLQELGWETLKTRRNPKESPFYIKWNITS